MSKYISSSKGDEAVARLEQGKSRSGGHAVIETTYAAQPGTFKREHLLMIASQEPFEQREHRQQIRMPASDARLLAKPKGGADLSRAGNPILVARPEAIPSGIDITWLRVKNFFKEKCNVLLRRRVERQRARIRRAR